MAFEQDLEDLPLGAEANVLSGLSTPRTMSDKDWDTMSDSNCSTIPPPSPHPEGGSRKTQGQSKVGRSKADKLKDSGAGVSEKDADPNTMRRCRICKKWYLRVFMPEGNACYGDKRAYEWLCPFAFFFF